MDDRKTGKNGTYLNLYPGSSYDPTVYERPTLTVDLCIFRVFEGKLQILLITRGQEPCQGMFAFPGGYVDIKSRESSDDAAYRELAEETGVKTLKGVVRQFKTYANYARDPRWYTTDIVYYYFVGKDEIEKIQAVAGDDAATVQWVDAHNTPDLAFDHKMILTELLHHMHERVWDYDVLFTLGQIDESTFTLPGLYDAYVAITGDTKLDRSNFPKKLRTRYKFSACGGTMRGLLARAGRPAIAYTLD